METTKLKFTPKDVMALREKTGLGMMDCKAALTEAEGDAGKAEEILRAKMKGKMDTRTERTTGEGRVNIAVSGSDAVIIEVRCETDFTARNDDFQKMVQDVTAAAMKMPPGPVNANDAITKRVDDVRITTGENMSFARGEHLRGGSFGSYLHHDGKRGALIQIEGKADPEVLAGVCMHIVAHVPPPIGITQADIPAQTLQKVRDDAVAEAKETGKPDQIAQKIGEGKVRKFLEENTLMDQVYVKDPSGKKPVREILPKDVKVLRFLRYTVGG